MELLIGAREIMMLLPEPRGYSSDARVRAKMSVYGFFRLPTSFVRGMGEVAAQNLPR